MATPINNFAIGTVDPVGYDAAATSIDLAAGHGSRFPSTFPFPAVWWNATDYPNPADDPNKEIVLVQGRTGDTVNPIVRAQEGTAATAKNTASKTYRFMAGITKAVYDSLLTHSLSQSFRGLTMQTHPDSDKRLTHIRLTHADAIVMHDGEEVSDWNNLDFDIAAAVGIGGLDMGTEQSSTWYKLYAMYNGTTKGLMGQRAKDYLLDGTYTSGEDASQGLRSNVDNSTVKIAQGRKFATAGPLEFFDIKLIKTGTPTGAAWLTLEADSAGVPSGTPLATSDKFDVSKILTTATTIRVPSRTPYSVSVATQYHVVLQGDYAVSNTDYISWRMDGSAATYADGAKALYDSDTATWTTDTDDDLICTTYVTENDTALVVPTGYRYAHIGWARNDSSGNLVAFRQYDRHWQYANFDFATVANELAASATLYDLRTWLPPITCLVSFAGTGTGAAGGSIAMGDIKFTNVTNAVGGPFMAAGNTGITTEFPSASLTPFVVEYNAVMADATAGTDLFVSGFMF